jgi:ribosomal protein S18 acetylase RimI-like enzyme
MQAVTIRTTTEDDWREVRALRLAMLADTPMAYGEHRVDAEGYDEQEWRARGRRGQDLGSTSLVAVDEHGTWIGMMNGYVPDAETGPLLVGVYVAPDHRGRGAGVADALLDAVEEWAVGHGATLRLHVHEDNGRARAFYERRGFVVTGHTEPYELDPTRVELEMVRELDGAVASRA